MKALKQQDHQHGTDVCVSTEENTGRAHYGATGAAGHIPIAPSRKQWRGARPRRYVGEGIFQLSGVEEGDETSEGAERGPSTERVKQKAAVPARMFFMLIALAAMAPLLVIGPVIGKEAVALPSKIPAHQWAWMDVKAGRGQAPHLMKGAHLAQITQKGVAKLKEAQAQVSASGIENALKDAIGKRGGEDLLRTLAKIQRADDAMMGVSVLPGQHHTQQMQQGLPQSAEEVVKVGHRSIWNYGPFIFTVGVMVSILAKLLFAQPLAKLATDLLMSWAGTQELAENSQEYYGYVYLERDEEFAAPSPRSTTSKNSRMDSQRTHATTLSGAMTTTNSQSQFATPRPASGDMSKARLTPLSTGSQRASSGKKKWPVSLDLPEHGARHLSFSSSMPQPAPGSAIGASAGMNDPLPIVSPDSCPSEASGLTSAGESIITLI